LQDPPGGLDLDVVLVGEQCGEAFALPVGEQVGAGVQGPPGPVPRVAREPAVAVELELDPAPAAVQSIPSEADDVERVHHGHRLGERFAGGGLEPGEPVHRNDLDGVAPRLWPVGEPGLERGLGPSFDHVQQAGGAGAVADRGEVDDDGDVLAALAGVPPTCSSTPTTATPSNRAGSAIRTRFPSARTASLAVFHATPSASATRATVRCWTTRPVKAHANPARETFARASAALLVSWRHT